MAFAALFDRGSLMIAGLAVSGLFLIFASLVLNTRVAYNVRADLKHREKLLEYYRNTLSQLGVILLGIGVSLSVFYFQQNYQEQARRKAEIQQTLARMALQLARGAALMPSLAEYDDLLDAASPYEDPSSGHTAAADRLTGEGLAAQIAKIRLIQVDVDARDFEQMNISRLLESSSVVNELDPALWFNIVRDESDIHYAVAQLAIDYRDLGQVTGESPPAAIAADPARAAAAKQQILEIYYDTDLLRRSGRRLLARTCWMLSSGPDFLALKPLDPLEADAATHKDWIDRAAPVLQKAVVGSEDCHAMLGYRRST